jgi:ABC-2 type transport system permease protein
MNVLRIMLKELKVIRDPKMLLFLLVSPLLTMLILGTALTNAFNGSLTVEEINILYKNSSSSSELSKYWGDFTGQMRQAGIQLEKADEKTDGKIEVKNNRYTGYVEISDSGLKYYSSSQSLQLLQIVTDWLLKQQALTRRKRMRSWLEAAVKAMWWRSR